MYSFIQQTYSSTKNPTSGLDAGCAKESKSWSHPLRVETGKELMGTTDDDGMDGSMAPLPPPFDPGVFASCIRSLSFQLPSAPTATSCCQPLAAEGGP